MCSYWMKYFSDYPCRFVATVYVQKHSIRKNSRSQNRTPSIREAGLGNSVNSAADSFKSDETPNWRHCSMTNLKITLRALSFVLSPIYSFVFFEYLPHLQWINSLHMQQWGRWFHAEKCGLGIQEAIIPPCCVSHPNSFGCVTRNESKRITSSQPKSYLTCTQIHACTNSIYTHTWPQKYLSVDFHGFVGFSFMLKTLHYNCSAFIWF